MFLAQVAKCYQQDLSEFPAQLVNMLEKHATVLDANMRLSFCRALILLRNKVDICLSSDGASRSTKVGSDNVIADNLIFKC